jgi:hypothetical protein
MLKCGKITGRDEVMDLCLIFLGGGFLADVAETNLQRPGTDPQGTRLYKKGK